MRSFTFAILLFTGRCRVWSSKVAQSHHHYHYNHHCYPLIMKFGVLSPRWTATWQLICFLDKSSTPATHPTARSLFIESNFWHLLQKHRKHKLFHRVHRAVFSIIFSQINLIWNLLEIYDLFRLFFIRISIEF